MRQVALGFAVLVLLTPVCADNTLFGGTGGAVLPTADVLPRGQWVGSVDWFDVAGYNAFPLRLTYGLTRDVEVGGLLDLSDPDDLWGLNGKWAIGWPRTSRGTTAVGARFQRMAFLDEGWQAYAVYTHNFGRVGSSSNWRGSLGVNFTHVDIFGFDDTAFRIFGAVEAIYGPWSLGAEIQSESSSLGDADPLASLWARYRADDRWTWRAGFTNSGPGGLVATGGFDFFLGATYAFGGGTVIP